MAMAEVKLHLLMIWANLIVTTVNSIIPYIDGEHIFLLEIEIYKS